MFFKTVFLFFSGVFLVSGLHAQASATPNMKNPVSYGNVQWSAQEAHFSFGDLGEREILKQREMTFYAPTKVEMSFRVKIKPDGQVAYVAAPRCGKDKHEYRKGGTSTLYGYQFTPVPESEGEQWVEVLMTVGE